MSEIKVVSYIEVSGLTDDLLDAINRELAHYNGPYPEVGITRTDVDTLDELLSYGIRYGRKDVEEQLQRALDRAELHDIEEIVFTK